MSGAFGMPVGVCLSHPSESKTGSQLHNAMDGEFTETGINRRTCRHVLKGSGTAGQVSAEGQGRGGGRHRENFRQYRPKVKAGKRKSESAKADFHAFY